MSIDFIKGLSPDEQEYVWKIREPLINIIEDFKRQGLLETQRSKNEFKAINLIIQNANIYTETMEAFAKRLGMQRINKEKLNALPISTDLLAWIIIVISHYLSQVENFKNYFLYLLNRKKIGKIKTLGQLMVLIRKVSPNHWPMLDNLVSSEFRNALAHSQFWIEEHEIHYVYNDNYDQYKAVSIFDFVTHARQQNIISSSLGDLIQKYYMPTIK